jgi:hypothetical protein
VRAKRCLVCRWQEIGKIVKHLDQSDESPLRERHTVKRLLLPLTTSLTSLTPTPSLTLRIFCEEHHLILPIALEGQNNLLDKVDAACTSASWLLHRSEEGGSLNNSYFDKD